MGWLPVETQAARKGWAFQKLIWELAARDQVLPRGRVGVRALDQVLKGVPRVIAAQLEVHQTIRAVQEALLQENPRVIAAKPAGHQTTKIRVATMEMTRIKVEIKEIKGGTAVKNK